MLIKYKLLPKSPISIGTGKSAQGIANNIVVRSANGIAYIPGSSIKGILRSECRRFAQTFGFYTHDKNLDPLGCLNHTKNSPCLLCKLFGSVHYPSNLIFENISLNSTVTNILERLALNISEKSVFEAQVIEKISSYGQSIRSNNRIDPKTRTAANDHLFFTECVDPDTYFIGEIRSSSNCKVTKTELAFLAMLLQSVNFIGGRKSAGLGRCLINIEQFIFEGENLDWKKTIEGNSNA